MSTVSMAPLASVRSDARHWYGDALLRAIALAATCVAAAVHQAMRLSALADNNVWCHLRTGLWIAQTDSVPRSGLFTQYPWLPWVDSSWGFDLLSAAAYRMFALSGVPIFMMLLQAGIAAALFLLAYRTSRKFWPAVILAGVAQLSIVPLQPRPALCSIIFLAIELALLLEARRTGDLRVLYGLPLAFGAWANLDRQFSYGLLLLLLFVVAELAEKIAARAGITWFSRPSRIRLSRIGLIAAAALLATFVSPYGWHLHAQLWQGMSNSAADRFFRELHAMRFRQPQDYLTMLLAMSAFFALGRRRSRDLFLLLILVFSTVISFRFLRDNWLVVVVAVGIVASSLDEREQSEAASNQLEITNVAGLAALLSAMTLVAAVVFMPGKAAQRSRMEASFPTRASDYIRQSHLAQPIFNTYEWGGFLTWYLPEYPVSMDGRRDLYGDNLNLAYFELMQAQVPLESDPSFSRAQTILLETKSPMAQALSTLPGFRVVYRDDQALVLARDNP